MKTLIIEDELTARFLLKNFLIDCGQCDEAVDGAEGVKLFERALKEGAPYDLVCLDIVMPNVDGHEALKRIRQIERDFNVKHRNGVHVVMITVKDDMENIKNAFGRECSSYIKKPIDKKKLLDTLRGLGFELE